MIDLNALPSFVVDDVYLQGVETFMFSILDLFHSSLCALVSGGFTCSRSEPRQTFTRPTHVHNGRLRPRKQGQLPA